MNEVVKENNSNKNKKTKVLILVISIVLLLGGVGTCVGLILKNRTKTPQIQTADHLNELLNKIQIDNLPTVHERLKAANITKDNLSTLDSKCLYSYKLNKFIPFDDNGYVLKTIDDYQ